jgi:hypothetical protein
MRYSKLSMRKSILGEIADLITHTTKCVGCGYCCASAICEYGRESEERGGCAYLYFKDGRYWCDAVKPRKWFGTGCGCSYRNTWRADVQFRGWER